MESWKSQRPPFFRLLLEGCKLSWKLAPKCLAVIIPFFALSSGLNFLWNWLLTGEFGGALAVSGGEFSQGFEMGDDLWQANTNFGFINLCIGILISSVGFLGTAAAAWITVRRMEGETPSLGDAFRRLGQKWGTVYVAGLLTNLLVLFPMSLSKGLLFLGSLDAVFLSATFGILMGIAIMMGSFYTLRMAFVATVPLVEGAGVIESVKRSNFLVKGNTGYMFLLMCFLVLLMLPTFGFLFLLNSNFIEHTLATVEATARGEVSDVLLEMGSPWSPVGIAFQLLNTVFFMYFTVTMAALYQHLRKLKSA